MFIRSLFAAVLTASALHAAAAVDANSASRADLETVKGVGPGLAGKIVEARTNAPFKDWNDMVERVGGIGPGNAARFSQAGLTVAGARYPAGAAKPAGEAGAKARKSADKSTDKGADKKAEKSARP